ncbi:hypothetical protein HY498_04355 [Candidatus Woesearchaeota archaeon]|nr:hypothetical protein [Candidatus Woesearchaeota archaeon]
MDFEVRLERIGLSRQEATVYINTLKLGTAKASEIAQKSLIKREACYYILKLLQEKGFISETIKSGVKHYSAISPKRILDIFEDERQHKIETIKEILPELESLQKVAFKRPKVEVYEGVEGFKTAISNVLEAKGQTVYAYVPEKPVHLLPTFHPYFRRRRRENKVFLKVIGEKSEFMENLRKTGKKELREVRYNNKLMKDKDTLLYILPESILLLRINEKEQLGIYVEDEALAKFQKEIFDIIWKLSE